MKKILSYGVLVLIVMMVGCDIIEKDSDVADVKSIRLYAASNKAAVIDLKKVFPTFNGVTVNDNSGKVKYFSDQYIKYKSAVVGGDRFSFNVKSGSKDTRVNVNLTTQGEEGCEENEAFTYAQIASNEVLVVNLLNNPEFCGYDIFSVSEIGISGSRSGIDEDVNSAGVNIAICACYPEGNSAILTYAPPTGFTGQVKFKYYLHTSPAGTHAQYGDVVYWDPQYSDYFTAHEVVIDVTNSSI